MTRKKKIRKVLYAMLITTLVFILILAAIILHPQPLFAYEVKYQQFRVYSSEKVDDTITPILDSVLSLVSKSELYDPAYEIDLFLAYNTFFNKVDDKVLGYGPTAKAIDNNLIFKVRVDITKNLVYPTFHKPCEADFTYLITHEVMHCLQAHKYGILKFNPFKHPEMWKLEGYPEYVARQKFSASAESLRNEIARYTELKRKQTDIWISVEEGGCEAPEYYYKGRLMTEYLMNIKHLTYDRILKDKRSEEEIYSEMIGWMTNPGAAHLLNDDK